MRQRIALFVCDWAYATEIRESDPKDLPDGSHLVKVKCIGRIDPALLLDFFLEGVGGILVVGCGKGNCHFIEGNVQAENKISIAKRLLDLAGFHHERLELHLASLDEHRFREIVEEFVSRIQLFGKTELQSELSFLEIREKIEAAKLTLERFRMRALVGKVLELTEEGNVYGEKISVDDFWNIVDKDLETEFLRNWIYLILQKRNASVRDLSKKLGVDSKNVLSHIVAMKQEGRVSLERIDGLTPVYAAMEGTR